MRDHAAEPGRAHRTRSDRRVPRPRRRGPRRPATGTPDPRQRPAGPRLLPALAALGHDGAHLERKQGAPTRSPSSPNPRCPAASVFPNTSSRQGWVRREMEAAAQGSFRNTGPGEASSSLRDLQGAAQSFDRLPYPRDLETARASLAVRRDQRVSLEHRFQGRCTQRRRSSPNPSGLRPSTHAALEDLCLGERRTFSELIRVTRSMPSLAEISPRRAAPYSAARACERTSVGATSWCSAATSMSPAAIRSSVSQSTTWRVTRQTVQPHGWVFHRFVGVHS